MLLFWLKLLLICASSVIVLGATNNDCESKECTFNPFPYESPYFPLLLNKRSEEIAKIQFNEIKLKHHDVIVRYCPNEENQSNNLFEPKLTPIVCECGSLPLAKDELEPWKCDSELTADVKLLEHGCANDPNTVAYKLGFSLPFGHFSSFLEGCYDFFRKTTLYVRYDIDGILQLDNELGLMHMNVPEDYYEKRGDSVVKVTKPHEEKDKKQHDFHIIHYRSLVAKKDFAVPHQVYASTNEITTVPMYKMFSEENWHLLEHRIRRSAVALGRIYKIITGIYSKLESIHGGVSKIPEYIWKIVVDEKVNRGIVFILHNMLHSEGYLCKNLCEGRYDKKSGIISCCLVDDFLQNVPNVPYVKVNGNLLEPHSFLP